LHGDGKVVLGLRGEEDVDGLLGEGLVAGGRGADLDDVQLAALHGAHSEAEKGAQLRVALHFELSKGGGVPLDGLTALSLNTVQLHGARHSVLLRRNTNQQQPLLLGVRPVINDLAAVQRRVPLKHLHRRAVP